MDREQDPNKGKKKQDPKSVKNASNKQKGREGRIEEGDDDDDDEEEPKSREPEHWLAAKDGMKLVTSKTESDKLLMECKLDPGTGAGAGCSTDQGSIVGMDNFFGRLLAQRIRENELSVREVLHKSDSNQNSPSSSNDEDEWVWDALAKRYKSRDQIPGTSNSTIPVQLIPAGDRKVRLLPKTPCEGTAAHTIPQRSVDKVTATKPVPKSLGDNRDKVENIVFYDESRSLNKGDEVVKKSSEPKGGGLGHISGEKKRVHPSPKKDFVARLTGLCPKKYKGPVSKDESDDSSDIID